MPIKKLFLIPIFLLLINMNVNSQDPGKNYEAEWKKVESFSQKGLPKSALEELQKLLVLAKKDGQDAQIIKALAYSISLQSETREKNNSFTITDIENEIKAFNKKEPATSILKSLLAEMYWNFYEQYRWQLYDRTTTKNFKKEDIAAWGAEDFHNKISELYLESIVEEALLKKTSPEAYNAIIIKGNVRHLRPTLYDVLAFRALSYFENDERDIKKPAYAFEINEAAAFDAAASFVTKKFSTKDSSSLKHKALIIYQKLLAFHLNDAKPDALIDADLHRLKFVKENSTLSEKDALYTKALKQITDKYNELPAASQVWYLIAEQYVHAAENYKPYGDTTNRYDKIKALDICNKIIQQKDSSEGKINCQNLLQELNSRSLAFKVEKVNIPNQPFRSLVSYRNISKIYLRLIKADAKMREALEKGTDENYWTTLIKTPSFKNWEQSLPDTKDLQEHNVEIKIDALPLSEYILVMSDSKDFSSTQAILGARYFYVSNISYINSEQDYFVLNRDNGQPLSKATVQVWEQKYDYKVSKYIITKGKLYTTDANGFFKLESNKKEDYYTSLRFEITHGNDKLFLNDQINNSYYSNQQTEKTKEYNSTFLFTDRSIYRPGQIVYFKGITITRNNANNNSTVKSGYATKVILIDANYKAIDTINVRTNEYGSFNGKFQLPQTGLNGSFTLSTPSGDGGTLSFRVEEYKRPKFYVDYEPVKGTYKVNDKIKITGVAKAYAGNNVDGALVSFRVVRKPRFIYDWLFWRWWQPPVESMEIVHGEAKTDKDGKYIIEFTAIPDSKIDPKLEPVFDYEITADVTDINGETRSGETTVSVSYKALMLSANVPHALPYDSVKKLSIKTENMNGEFIPAQLKVTISKLKAEDRLIRSRYWERPDQFVMSKSDYIKYFPNDEYDNETDNKSWDKSETSFDKTDSSKASGEWLITNGKFSPGFYVIEIIAKDSKGEEVKELRYFELYDDKSKNFVLPQYLWTGIINTVVQPGETASVELGSAADNLFVVQQVNKKKENNTVNTDYSFIKLNNQKQKFSFNVTEADRGGYGVGWIFVKNNRYYQFVDNISVPWSNKDLTIEYASFRDKTLPGSEEKWKVKITGYKNEKVAAEMLASMYDASLDQFYSQNWSKPNIWPTNYFNNKWNGYQNFGQITSQQKYVPDEPTKSVEKIYDFLYPSVILSPNYLGDLAPLWATRPLDYAFTEAGGASNHLYYRGMAAMDMAAPSPKMAEGRISENNGNLGGLLKKEINYLPDTIQQVKIENQIPQSGDVKIRKNFNETAFFLPDLRTDSTGAIEFSFTMPEALTRWKFMALAHTKDASFGYSTKEIITQKDLMVQPNAPRFLREGDKLEFSSKIVNMTDKEITGTAELQLFDATTNEPIDGWFSNMAANQYFTMGAGQSEAVSFPIEVPYLFNKALVWRIIAKFGNNSDGEENVLPVLTNRMLVTETMPLPMNGVGTKNFVFNKLLESKNSKSLQNYSLTLEYTSNPAWYAVQALPYLMEYPYDCAEQTWNRYYANSLAAYIANSSPKIKEVFEKWKIKDTAALMSNLEKNQELKAVLLEETPWVLDAKNQAQQKKNIALLFDMIHLSKGLNTAFDKLKQNQSSNGGFVWFTGGPDDRYMTQYIVTGIGHLKKLNAIAKGQEGNLKSILDKAMLYLDNKIKQDYDNLIKYKTNLKTYTLGYYEIQYLYMRSFFSDYPINKAAQTAYNYYRSRLPINWVKQSKYMQGMIALTLNRTGDTKTPAAILKSLKETSITNEEMGMYWKNQTRGWFWYEAPIETQALLIEAFQEVGKDTKTVDALKTWLLKNKQTNDWKTTKATAEACYALLIQGSQWLSNVPAIEVKLGNTVVKSTDVSTEAGSGYFKKIIEGNKVEAEMGKIAVTVKATSDNKVNNQTSATWGGVYWQYFEDLDKITTAATPLNLSKKLFVEKNTDRGPVITPVKEGDVLHVGDKIKVRIELRVDRDMEYVHMKDMRASATEPVNVLSQYKWQDGLGYYESTKDASTNFFFNNLRKGTYVFEYPLFVTHTGNFSNGITTIQSMYAPEFSSHSEGVRITVE
ncbi:MAG: alpha-2-macroglobulin [Bacteroidetes bacterium]|nr:alpha-2-macroglobulin [Bacteroidota bacterium]